MKKIEAIVKPFKLDDVLESLRQVGVSGVTVTEVRGFRLGEKKHSVNGVFVDFVPKTKLEVVLPDNLVSRAVEAIEKGAQTRRAGDGLIFVLPIEETVRIRTGERGEEGL